MSIKIDTERLTLLACDAAMLKAAIAGDVKLSEQLNVSVAENWTEFGAIALQYGLEKISSSQNELGWWTYFPIHKHDNCLIGSGGYKGSPDENGCVEIGYEITPAYRNKGLATELAQALTNHAFTFAHVNTVVAHTLGEINASNTVLQKLGFKKTKEINDPDEGMIWKWELKRIH